MRHDGLKVFDEALKELVGCVLQPIFTQAGDFGEAAAHVVADTPRWAFFLTWG